MFLFRQEANLYQNVQFWISFPVIFNVGRALWVGVGVWSGAAPVSPLQDTLRRTRTRHEQTAGRSQGFQLPGPQVHIHQRGSATTVVDLSCVMLLYKCYVIVLHRSWLSNIVILSNIKPNRQFGIMRMTESLRESLSFVLSSWIFNTVRSSDGASA